MIKFLKHIERTGILVHLIDSGEVDPDDPLAAYNLINRELSMYSDSLSGKTQIIVLNKTDLTGTENRIKAFKAALPHRKVVTISAATGDGVSRLVKILAKKLARENRDDQDNPETDKQ